MNRRKMEAATGHTVTIKVDTLSARQEVEEFQRYALQVLEEIRAAYASAGQELFPAARRSL